MLKKHFFLYLFIGLAFPLFVSCNLVPIDEEDPVPAAVINFATTSATTSVNVQSLDIGLSVSGDITTATTINVSLTSPSGTVPSVSITTPSFVLSPGEAVPSINLQISRNGQEIYTEASQFTLTLASESTANVVVGASDTLTLTLSEDRLVHYYFSLTSTGNMSLIRKTPSEAEETLKTFTYSTEESYIPFSYYLSIDINDNHIYYATGKSIRRCDLEGQNEQVLKSNLFVWGLEINPTTQKIIWIEYQNSLDSGDHSDNAFTLKQMNYDGSNEETLHSGIIGVLQFPVIDTVNNQLLGLFVDETSTYHVTIIDFLGENVAHQIESRFIRDSNSPAVSNFPATSKVGLDKANQHLYFINANDTLIKYSMSKATEETLVSGIYDMLGEIDENEIDDEIYAFFQVFNNKVYFLSWAYRELTSKLFSLDLETNTIEAHYVIQGLVSDFQIIPE